ncbi:hypothetical protein [Jiulongibacter sediminis]|uniref:Uncharacterized protein n=1 Tax=Jiulongibacter sediminis TaxID=1605367 RepID=A0A0P7BM18_9BACT|nr:hypothetical protein [Jiulongibacter sediminis]KPM48297.1 hypothetical protein AFM12_06485 [Jiulongibacter sediminis]TBX24836.1 hypothetical protein TK44_06490 [Jiulongibacter sediminis]
MKKVKVLSVGFVAMLITATACNNNTTQDDVEDTMEEVMDETQDKMSELEGELNDAIEELNDKIEEAENSVDDDNAANNVIDELNLQKEKLEKDLSDLKDNAVEDWNTFEAKVKNEKEEIKTDIES